MFVKNLLKQLGIQAQYLLLIPALGLHFIILDNVIQGSISEGESMMPTLPTQSCLLVDKFFYKLNNKKGIAKGNIIIAKSPVNNTYDICKRVVYLENEVVNGIKIPKNHIWVEGDNKEQSFDSRLHGPIPISLVKGRVIFSLYPFKKII